MKQEMRTRLLPVFVIATLAFGPSACQKRKPPVVEAPPPSEHVAPSPVGTNQTVLRQTFSVKNSATFPFEIPAHAATPHLHGNFESFINQAGVSDDEANIDFLIVNAAQYADLAGNHPSEALFSADDSHNQSVNLDLPPSMDQPAKYYLIFRNSAAKGPARIVKADFHVDF
jgi:hypothetical protein